MIRTVWKVGLLTYFTSFSYANIPISVPLKCKVKAESILKNWKSLDDWRNRAAIAGPEEPETILATPTSKIGNWIYVKIWANGNLELAKRTPVQNLVVRLSTPECSPSFAISNTEKTNLESKSFNDLHLEKILKEHRSGIIFVWSSEMPLSIAALKHMKKVAEQKRISFIPLLAPSSPIARAEEFAKREKFPSEFLMKMDSVELDERDMNLHYPSYITFSSGKLNSSSVRGYSEEDGYLQIINKELGEQ